MGKKSRDKGKRGEREWAAYLSKHGFPARRGVQYRGGPDSPDIVCDVLPEFHFEVKRTERLMLHSAIEQAALDATDGQIPLVAHKKNHQPWLVILTAHDFMRLLKAKRS